jgi:hypothetical protein
VWFLCTGFVALYGRSGLIVSEKCAGSVLCTLVPELKPLFIPVAEEVILHAKWGDAVSWQLRSEENSGFEVFSNCRILVPMGGVFEVDFMPALDRIIQ